jgi:hypothetical protein
MAILKRRTRHEVWSRHRERAKHAWLVPFYALEWVWTWLAYWLSGWAFLEVLEYLGNILFAFFISVIPALLPVVGLKELHLDP